MAVEFCPPTSPENPPSRGMSPRISFSHALSQYDVVPIEPHLPLNPSSLFASANFNFHSNNNLRAQQTHQSSSADELFSNGVLLPLQEIPTKKQLEPTSENLPNFKSLPPAPPPLPPTPPCEDIKTGEGQSQSNKSSSSSSYPSSSSSSSSSSFWKFKRSRSFNCGSIYRGTLCPLLLSRSKSTGSNSSSKRSLVSKEEHHHHNHRNHNLGGGCKQRSISSSSYTGYHRPPLKKSYGSNAGTGVTVSPVLNVSSGNLFGFGSIFSSIGKGGGGDKSKKKKLAI